MISKKHTRRVARDAKQARAALAKDAEVAVTIVRGVAGLAVYINGYRVAGEKPWGGGPIEKEWQVLVSDIKYALGGRQ